MTKSMKRIHKVTLKRMVDEDADTSYLDQPEFHVRRYEYDQDKFCFIGIRAEAEVSLCRESVTDACWTVQTITSGGLWAIESDSSPDYLKEIEDEQLSELREQLKAIGFSSRAISAAFKTIERAEE